jgi:hypothetical protein
MGIFSFLESSKPNILKEMGFVNDQDGIIDRYAREKYYWDIHLNKSKQTILEAVAIHKPSTLAILGSGWLLDVPLEELSKKCSMIYLYDIVHPSQIKHRVSKFTNVAIIEADITGGSIQKAWNEVQQWKKEGGNFDITNIPGDGFIPHQQTDMVISLNILNQLDILICDYLLESTTLQNEDVETLRKNIQQRHIESLQKQAFCLISDIEETVTDIKTKAVTTRSLLQASLPESMNQNQWEWQFDSTGNYYEGKQVTFHVQARF